jgi:hypothetical protein
VKVVLFCIILFHFFGDDCQSIPTFFLQLASIRKKIVFTTRYESLLFSLICLINSGYALVINLQIREQKYDSHN